MEYKDLFKAMRVRAMGESLAKRCQSMKAERQEKRREFFWGGVVASDISKCTKAKEIEEKKNSRIEMLKKWKTEKMKRLEEAKKKQKPVFKVGVVQRKITGSPVYTQRKTCVRNNLVNKQFHVKSQINDSKDRKAGVITRARARNMAVKPVQTEGANSTIKTKTLNNKFCKIDKSKKQEVNSHTFKVPEVVCKLPCSSLTLAYSPKFTRKSKKLQSSEVKAAAQLELQSEKDVPKENFPVQGEKCPDVPKENFSVQGEKCPDVPKENFPVQGEKCPDVPKENFSVQGEKCPDASKENFPVQGEECPNIPKENFPVQGEKFPNVPKENIPGQKKEPLVTTPEKPQTEQDDFRPIHYSPFVTVRSGKKSARKSKKKLTMDVEEQIKKEEKEFQCRIFSFRKYIDCETKRLADVCDKWKRIYEEFPELPSDVEGDIDSAVGKTNLLTSDKFNQFRGLIDKCENGDPFVKVDDLQGFQDWVSIEVERIDEEFHKLESRKCNNWKLEIVSAQVVKKQQVKPLKNAIKKPVGKSNIRSHILAARKLLKEGGNTNGGEGSQLPDTFSLEEAVKAKTPRKDQSLLREVLNPERKTKNESSAKKLSVARERRNSGLEIMIATQKNKFPTPIKKSPVVTDYEVLFGQDTPTNRSILKKTPKAPSSSKAHVTFKKLTENILSGGRGLSEKYFQPVMDPDENSPMRTVLGDLGNLSVGGMRTRSRTRQMSCSPSMSPLVM